MSDLAYLTNENKIVDLYSEDWVKLKHISYKVLTPTERNVLAEALAAPLESTLPIIFLSDALIKTHNKKATTPIVESDVLAFIRTEIELSTGQKIRYLYYRTVKDLVAESTINTDLEEIPQSSDE